MVSPVMKGAADQAGAAGSINITDRTVLDSQMSGTARAEIWFQSGGQLALDPDANPSDEWQNPVGFAPGGDYDIRATLSSGSTPDSGPALNTWHSLGTGRAWSNSQTGSGTSQSELFIEIRDASSGAILDSATMTISATIL